MDNSNNLHYQCDSLNIVLTCTKGTKPTQNIRVNLKKTPKFYT